MASSPALKTPAALQSELQQIEENSRTLLGVSTTRATVAQTPKQVIWTLNKAKLYRYIPVVPAEQRHKIPLFLVFALMNKPYILDLRPGYSFIEYMVDKGYDVYLLDWGTPGIEDKELKFDDYVLDYITRAVRKVKAVSGSDELSMLGWWIGYCLYRWWIIPSLLIA
jgi:polyhydroxyalkanoate synthase